MSTENNTLENRFTFSSRCRIAYNVIKCLLKIPPPFWDFFPMKIYMRSSPGHQQSRMSKRNDYRHCRSWSRSFAIQTTERIQERIFRISSSETPAYKVVLQKITVSFNFTRTRASIDAIKLCTKEIFRVCRTLCRNSRVFMYWCTDRVEFPHERTLKSVNFLPPPISSIVNNSLVTMLVELELLVFDSSRLQEGRLTL